MPRRSPRVFPRLQPLEARHAPATLVDAKSVTFQDVDGDAVTVTLSKPVLTAANANTVFTFAPGTVDGSNAAPQQLQTIDLSSFGNGIGVKVVVEQAGAGDGKANVGWVRADNRDVGPINIAGDLGRITAGDASAKSTGLASLTVDSLGKLGTTTQAPGGTLASLVNGRLGFIRIAGDMLGARVQVTGGASGKIGRVDIGGKLQAHATNPDTGLIDAAGSIGPVKIGGNLEGGGGANSGIRAGGNLGAVTIGGSMIGGAGSNSGALATVIGNIGPVRIAGDLQSGAGVNSASIRAIGDYVYPPDPNPNDTIYPAPRFTGGKVISVAVAGDIIGVGVGGASIYATKSIGPVTANAIAGGDKDSASLRTTLGGIGAVKVTNSIVGGAGDSSAAIISGTGIGPVTIGGSLTGGDGPRSASIHAAGGNLGAVRIGGDLTGAFGTRSAAIAAYSTYTLSGAAVGGRIASVTVTGNMSAGVGNFGGQVYASARVGPVKVTSISGGGGTFSSAIRSFKHIASVTVTNNVAGGGGTDSASIAANGNIGPVKIGGDLLGGGGARSASIDGSKLSLVSIGSDVVGGAGQGSASILAVTTIGQIKVGANWTGASVAAGFRAGTDGFFGTVDDVLIDVGIVNKIAITGTVNGTAASTDYFAFLGANIKSFSQLGAPVALTPGNWNDNLAVGSNNDFLLVEK